jgi:C2 domain
MIERIIPKPSAANGDRRNDQLHEAREWACQMALILSRFFLLSTALVLFCGRACMAGALSGSATLLLQDVSGKSSYNKDVDKWLVLSLLSTEASIGSWGVLNLFIYFGAEDSQSMWYSTNILYRGMGLLILAMVLKDTRGTSSKEEGESIDDGAVLRRRKSLSSQSSRVEIQVLRGRNLVAKDRNLFGKYVSSDPYVRVKYGNAVVGQTSVVCKTLNPEWDSKAFALSLPLEAFEKHKSIECYIYDQDQLSSDDPMGMVRIPLDPSRDFNRAKWYLVEKGSGEEICEDASGELFVSVKYIKG